MSMNRYFAIIKAIKNAKIYHYAEVVDGIADLFCNQPLKEETQLEVFLNLTPDDGRVCKKCLKASKNVV